MTPTELYDYLKQVARNQATVNYGEIAPLLDLDLEDSGQRNRLSNMLGHISFTEHKEGHPLLSAVVILADKNRPGGGFFMMAQELELFSGSTEDDKDRFYFAELRRVHSYWAEH